MIGGKKTLIQFISIVNAKGTAKKFLANVETRKGLKVKILAISICRLHTIMYQNGNNMHK